MDLENDGLHKREDVIKVKMNADLDNRNEPVKRKSQSQKENNLLRVLQM